MITQKQIKDLTDLVVKRTEAERIYLFGSYATNSANENSDVDLLVVMNQKLSKEKRRAVAADLSRESAEGNLFFPKDFKVYSKEEFERLRENKNSFLYHILKTAKPLYVA